MSKSTRHLVNALICLVIGVHAVYWFASGRGAPATDLRVGLAVAQAVVGFAGAIWFYSRSRGAAG